LPLELLLPYYTVVLARIFDKTLKIGITLIILVFYARFLIVLPDRTFSPQEGLSPIRGVIDG